MGVFWRRKKTLWNDIMVSLLHWCSFWIYCPLISLSRELNSSPNSKLLSCMAMNTLSPWLRTWSLSEDSMRLRMLPASSPYSQSYRLLLI